MKALLWQGHSIETEDPVADAAFELARLLATRDRTERIDIPGRAGGHATTASLLVGAGVGLGMLTLPDRPEQQIPGAASAAAAISDRIAHLNHDAANRTRFRLPDDFSVLDHDITT